MANRDSHNLLILRTNKILIRIKTNPPQRDIMKEPELLGCSGVQQ